MDDLISRQAAIDAIEQMQMPIMRSEFPEEQYVFTGMSEALRAIKDLPSAQPEIIRCKNCTWWSDDEYRECSSPNYDNVHVTPAGFYCGYAERRSDGSD